MKNKHFPKTLPVLIGLFILVLGIGTGVFLIGQVRQLQTKAAADTLPEQVTISNIADSSFVVSWITSQATNGTVTLGTDSTLDEIKNDVRDKSSLGQKFLTHYVFIENLSPETKYYFKIISGGKTYDNSGKIYSVVTAPTGTPLDNDIAQGKILSTNGKPSTGAIVLLSLANGITQSALTDKNGVWLIVLSKTRTTDLKKFLPYDRSVQIEEIMVRGENLTAAATLNTANDNPAPDITLGQNKNFLTEEPAPTAKPGAIKEVGGFNFESPSPAIDKSLTITSPTENEQINSLQPEFFGSGPKEQVLDIIIESSAKIEDQIAVDKNGGWVWSPSTPLTVGKHKITLSYSDENGLPKKITRNFVVLAADNDLPSFTATPSGEKISPTANPTKTLSPTPTKKTQPSPTPLIEREVPVSGVALPTYVVLGAGVASFLIGLALIILL